MAGSTVVAVKRALVALLQARTNLTDVQVSYGWPGDDLAERERVFTGAARVTHEPASLKAGRTFRNESAELDVLVQVELVGGSQDEADDRAFVIGREIEECVADNRTLGTAGVNWVIVTGFALDNAYNAEGNVAQIRYTVTYNARLT